jgi:hypothetical protein
MGISNFFGFNNNSGYGLVTDMIEIFPFELDQGFFVHNDIITIYKKILIDVISHTQRLTPEVELSLYDNCMANESSKGLITLLADAMTSKKELFLVYKLGILRLADSDETEQIRLDYKERAQSSVGVYISFKNYKQSDLLKIYSNMEYAVLESLHKSMNLSKAIQVKISDLRLSVSNLDASMPTTQAKTIATGLAEGKDVLLDAKDEIKTATPEIKSTEEAISFIDSKKAFYLGFPMSYINGKQTTGIGTTGEGDTNAIERGLKHYFVSIVKPAIEAIFNIQTDFKSQDYRLAPIGIQALQTFELVDERFLSAEDKKSIIQKLFGLDVD